MIILNKAEAKKVREHFGDVALVRTCKGKSKRGHYYCEERKDVMAFVERMRNLDVEHIQYGKDKNGVVYYYTVISAASKKKMESMSKQIQNVHSINEAKKVSTVTKEMFEEAIRMLDEFNAANGIRY